MANRRERRAARAKVEPLVTFDHLGHGGAHVNEATKDLARARQARLTAWYASTDVRSMYSDVIKKAAAANDLSEMSKSALVLTDNEDRLGRQIASQLGRDVSKGRASLLIGPRQMVAKLVNAVLASKAMIGTVAAWEAARLPILVVGSECAVIFDHVGENSESHWYLPGLSAVPS